VTSGGKDLALRLEEEGYAPILAEAGLEGVVTDEAPAGEAPAGEAPAGEAPAGEAPAGEAPAMEAAH
jgi:hypothetical protein